MESLLARHAVMTPEDSGSGRRFSKLYNAIRCIKGEMGKAVEGTGAEAKGVKNENGATSVGAGNIKTVTSPKLLVGEPGTKTRELISLADDSKAFHEALPKAWQTTGFLGFFFDFLKALTITDNAGEGWKVTKESVSLTKLSVENPTIDVTNTSEKIRSIPLREILALLKPKP